jgi:hypothetical protein
MQPGPQSPSTLIANALFDIPRRAIATNNNINTCLIYPPVKFLLIVRRYVL